MSYNNVWIDNVAVVCWTYILQYTVVCFHLANPLLDQFLDRGIQGSFVRCPFNFEIPNAMQTCVSDFHFQSHQFIRFDFCSFRPDGFFGGCSTVHCTQCTAVLFLFLKRWRKSWTISFCSFRWLFNQRKSWSSKLLPLFFTPSRRVETSLSLYCLFGRLVRNAVVDECVCLCRIQASKKYHDQKGNHFKWMFFSLSLHRSKFI